MKVVYSVSHAHGQTDRGFATYEEAVAAVRLVYGDCEIGHDGDISDGGDRTLCWLDAEAARDSDGARACCSIRRAEVGS